MKSILLFALLLCSITTKATNYYFSDISGDDSRTNTAAQNASTPWKTLAKLNSVFSSFTPGDSILLKRGGTFYGSILINKSGTKTSPIVISAYGTGTDPVITGLVSLTWTSAGTGLWNSNEALSPDALNMVTVNGTPAGMGRWPNLDNNNGGYDTIRFSTSKTITDKPGLTTSPSAGKPSYFIGSEVVIRTKRWLLDRHPITGYNAQTSTITFDPSSTNEVPDNNKGYFIQDNSSVLDKQDEWWYNRSNSKVKIYSQEMPVKVSAANKENLLVASGKSYITIDHIAFNGCNADAILITDGSNFVVQNCILQNIGRNAINTGTPYSAFLKNTIVNVMSKGILINGGAGHSIIRYNTIKNVSQIKGLGTSQQEDNLSSFSGDGVYIKDDAVIIEYNTFVNMGYSAVHLTKVDSAIIRYNYINTVCNVYDDGGAIYSYTGTAYTSRNRQISNNIILNGIGAFYGSGVNGGSAAGAGVAGIYNDRGTSGIEENGNTVAYFEKGIFQNYGCNKLKITNNTFYNNSNGIQINTRVKDKSRNLTITGNIAFAATKAQKACYVYSDDGDVLNLFGDINNNYYTRPINDNITMSWQSDRGSDNIHDVSLAGWQAKFAMYDANSKKGTYAITDTSQIKFEYNATTANKTIALSGSYADAKGTIYSNSVTLLPFTSIILVQTSAQSEAPTVAITSPSADTSFTAPANITVTAGAADADGSIAKVEFFSGATLLKTETSFPYSFTWQNVASGNYTLTAKATDNDGNATTSPAITVSVNNPDAAASVSITSPSSDTTFTSKASINIIAAATDTDGSIAMVEFFSGDTLLKTEHTYPYAYNWKDIPAGNYTLTARATNNLGLVTTSAAVSVTVTDSIVAPVINITSPSASAVFNAPASVTITADATDADDSIVTVELYSGNILLTTEKKLPYSWKWENVAAGNYTITAKATDSKGHSSTSDSVVISVGTNNSASKVTNKSISAAGKAGLITDKNLPGSMDIAIGPNPASNTLSVFTHKLPADKKVEISIVNMSGGLLKTLVSNTAKQVIPINISSLIAGIYILKLQINGSSISKQFEKL